MKIQRQILGIDISKASFHVALLDCSGNEKTAVFKNNGPGFRQLNEWLEMNKVSLLHVCMEATSRYYEALAEFLYEKQHLVSVVNPQRIKGFAQSELRRSKTDRIDASLIARFAKSTILAPGRRFPQRLESCKKLNGTCTHSRSLGSKNKTN